MAEPLHGSFVIRRELMASPLEVYAAFTEPERRSRWVRLPGKPDPQNEYRSQPGVAEILRSSMRLEGRIEGIERRTRLVRGVPGRQVVFSYEAVVDDVMRWVSLVSVALGGAIPDEAALPDEAESCCLTWTEQYLLLAITGDGSGDVAHLRGGTELQLNGLQQAVGTGDRRPGHGYLS